MKETREKFLRTQYLTEFNKKHTVSPSDRNSKQKQGTLSLVYSFTVAVVCTVLHTKAVRIRVLCNFTLDVFINSVGEITNRARGIITSYVDSCSHTTQHWFRFSLVTGSSNNVTLSLKPVIFRHDVISPRRRCSREI